MIQFSTIYKSDFSGKLKLSCTRERYFLGSDIKICFACLVREEKLYASYWRRVWGHIHSCCWSLQTTGFPAGARECCANSLVAVMRHSLALASWAPTLIPTWSCKILQTNGAFHGVVNPSHSYCANEVARTRTTLSWAAQMQTCWSLRDSRGRLGITGFSNSACTFSRCWRLQHRSASLHGRLCWWSGAHVVSFWTLHSRVRLHQLHLFGHLQSPWLWSPHVK